MHRKKLAQLSLEIGGEDLTKADARLTQATIEEHLAVDLLARVAFHGQSDITALLEVTSLSMLVSEQEWSPLSSSSYFSVLAQLVCTTLKCSLCGQSHAFLHHIG